MHPLGVGRLQNGQFWTSLDRTPLRNRLQKDGRQFIRHFELDEMSAGQGVHRPTRIVLQLVIELAEERGISGQDIHLLFDTTNAARQLHRLGEGGERVRRTLTSQSAITSGRLRPKPADVIGATNQSSPGTVTRCRSGGNTLNKDCPFSGTKASR